MFVLRAIPIADRIAITQVHSVARAASVLLLAVVAFRIVCGLQRKHPAVRHLQLALVDLLVIGIDRGEYGGDQAGAGRSSDAESEDGEQEDAGCPRN